MSEVTVAILRLALLALLWFFVFAVVKVLRSDLYGTRVVTRRGGRHTRLTPMPDEPHQDRPAAGGNADGIIEPRRLDVLDGPESGASLALRRSPVVIGRNPESSLALHDDSVSGRHARIHPGARGWIIEDLSSTNGTWVDGERLHGSTPLVVGTQVRVGQTTLEARR